MKTKWRYTLNAPLLGATIRITEGGPEQVVAEMRRGTQGFMADFIERFIYEHKTKESAKLTIRFGAITQEFELLEIDDRDARFIEERHSASMALTGGLLDF